jgi:hypothetical protein
LKKTKVVKFAEHDKIFCIFSKSKGWRNVFFIPRLMVKSVREKSGLFYHWIYRVFFTQKKKQECLSFFSHISGGGRKKIPPPEICEKIEKKTKKKK